MRQPVFPVLLAALIGAFVPGAYARGQDPAAPSTMSEVLLPGGARAALAAIKDPGAADRSQLLLEVIRRSHETPMGSRGISRRDVVVRPLLAHLDSLGSRPTSETDTLPLPLSPAIWIDVVFGGRATPNTLVAEILRSPGAALLYCGLLSLDDATRAWIGTERELLAEIAARHAAAFQIAAPALRVENGRIRVPGGEAARAAWETLAGRHTTDPANFVRALVSEREGRLAYFYDAMGSLTAAQLRLALNLDSPDAARMDAARRMYTVYQRIAEGWNLDDRPFWRPSLDPALLIADLSSTGDGRPSLPGTRAFWNAVFEDGAVDRSMSAAAEGELLRGEPPDFAWLAEQVFRGGQSVQRRPYTTVLFASRVVKTVGADNVRDALISVRAAGIYPALVTALERGRLRDVALYARMVRRAIQLSANGDRGLRAIAQFSGAVALLTRAASRGSLTDETFTAAISALAAIEPAERGEYDGRLVRWLQKVVAASPAVKESSRTVAANGVHDPLDGIYQDAVSAFDRDTLRMMAGDVPAPPRLVPWEGTQYRLDFARAELMRLSGVLGHAARPYLSSAAGVLTVADALAETGLAREQLRQQTTAFEQIATALGCDTGENWTFSDAISRCRELTGVLQRAARNGDAGAAARVAPRLRALADDLLARALVELAYAVALGQPGAAPISAGEAASRHNFGLQALGFGPGAPWRFATAGADRTHDWHVTGSLLGLDVRLSHFALVSLSSKPPSLRPSINDEDRREIIETVTLSEPLLLADAQFQTIVAGLKQGRARAAGLRTAAEADAAADAIELGSTRRTLLKWAVINDRDRVDAFLSPTELLWLGAGRRQGDTAWQAWGVSGEPRLGCLCLQVTAPGMFDRLAGRWYSGIFATSFADLPLRLAELLAELSMPGALLAPVLTSATLDFITNARFRDADDRRGLVEYVQSLRVDNMEQYLGLLTTDGPLVPVADGPGQEQAGAAQPGSFVPLH